MDSDKEREIRTRSNIATDGTCDARFGPLDVIYYPDHSEARRAQVAPWKADDLDDPYVNNVATGSVDEMIKALRDAADWLEQRNGSPALTRDVIRAAIPDRRIGVRSEGGYIVIHGGNAWQMLLDPNTRKLEVVEWPNVLHATRTLAYAIDIIEGLLRRQKGE